MFRVCQKEPAEKTCPKGSREGLNDWKKLGCSGPCPPVVGRHRYFHRLYALDIVLGDLGRVTKRELLAKIEGHVREAGAVRVGGRNLGLAPGTWRSRFKSGARRYLSVAVC